jgi:hypothetical protein
MIRTVTFHFLHSRSLTLATSSNLHRRNLPSHLPLPISFFFCEYLEVASRGILPEERFHSFHFYFGQWAIIVFCFLSPVLPDADLPLSRSGVLLSE